MQRSVVIVPALLAAACGSLLAAPDEPAPKGTDAGTTTADDAGATTVPVIDPDASVAPAPCTARFCATFDDPDGGPLFGFKRFGPNDHEVAFFGARNDVGLSPPSSYRIVMDGDSTEGWLEADLGDALSGSVHVAFWLDAFPTDESAKIVALNCEEGDVLRVKIENGIQLAADSSDNAATLFGVVPMQKWIPLDFDFRKTSAGNESSAEATLRVGAVQTTVGRTNCSPPVRVRFGISPSGPTTYDVSFDDIAIDWKP